MLRAHAPDALLSPGAVHAITWSNERRLQHLARLLGSIEREGASSLAMDALDQLAKQLPAASGRPTLLARIDLGVVNAVVGEAWREATAAMQDAASTEVVREAWRSTLNLTRLVAADVDALLLIASSTCHDALDRPSAKGAVSLEGVVGELGRAAVRWRGLVVVHLFAQEARRGPTCPRPTDVPLTDAYGGRCCSGLQKMPL